MLGAQRRAGALKLETRSRVSYRSETDAAHKKFQRMVAKGNLAWRGRIRMFRRNSQQSASFQRHQGAQGSLALKIRSI